MADAGLGDRRRRAVRPGEQQRHLQQLVLGNFGERLVLVQRFVRSREAVQHVEKCRRLAHHVELRHFVAEFELSQSFLRQQSVSEGDAVVVGAQLDLPLKIRAGRQRDHGKRAAVGDRARLAPGKLEAFVEFAQLHVDDAGAVAQLPAHGQHWTQGRGANQVAAVATDRKSNAIAIVVSGLQNDGIATIGRLDCRLRKVGAPGGRQPENGRCQKHVTENKIAGRLKPRAMGDEKYVICMDPRFPFERLRSTPMQTLIDFNRASALPIRMSRAFPSRRFMRRVKLALLDLLLLRSGNRCRESSAPV